MDTADSTIGTHEDEHLDYEAILAEYRHRQMREHLTGPFVSLILHVILIFAAVFLLVGKETPVYDDIEVSIEELDIKELQPKVLEELEKLEQLAAEVVPTVEKPELPQEEAEVAVTDQISEEMAETDAEMDFADVLDIKTADTPLTLSGLYGGRTEQGREHAIRRYRGSTKTESAVLRALRWLKEHQNPDGSWARTQQPAMSGLALLAFLAHGETPVSEEFGMTVLKAIQYLVTEVNTKQRAMVRRGYTGGIVTYALSEAYGLTKIPMIRPAMEAGLTYIVDGQQPRGGWDYSYQKGDRWHLSVSGWQMQALKAGYVAGANVPGIERCMENAIRFVKEVTYKNGRFGYSSPGSGSNGMTAAGTLCLQLLGEGDSKEARAGLATLAPLNMDWQQAGNVHAGSYWWYYHTQAMFHGGRGYWRRWNNHFSEILVEQQKPDGHWESPALKDNARSHTAAFDDVYQTSLCCLMLQVYYRYLPTYKMPKKIVRHTESVLDSIDVDLGLEID